MAILNLIAQGLYETVLMVATSLILGIVAGGSLGIYLYYHSQHGLKPRLYLYHSLEFIINSIRSIPYIILTVLLIPLTRLLTGSSIGTLSAIVPLSLAAILLIARATEDTFKGIPKGLVEMGLALGAKPRYLIGRILLPEVLSPLIDEITNIAIILVGFSAMAGTVGGGGLGDLAIRYGYQRYDTTLMVLIVIILWILVQLIQGMGRFLSRYFRYH